MDSLVLGLVALNFILTGVLLLRKSGAPADTRALEQSIKSELQTHRNELRSTITESSAGIDNRIANFTTTVNDSLRQSREEMSKRLDEFAKGIQDIAAQTRRDAADGRQNLEALLTAKLTEVAGQLEKMREANDTKLAEISKSVETEMNKMRESNEQKLEKMRETVDEKLHGTLEKRLGESFQQVSEKLEAVQRGLGEMQSLATGVGDLKRVLTNVKSRGGWGEVQLGRQIEDMLTRDQYEVNAQVNPATADRVEYAVKLPGRAEGEYVFLPIDAKFPQEDYERLLQAQETGTTEEIESAGRQIETVVKTQAKTISDKYIAPPNTTDFAIMYLPTEGLFAEVIRRPGLCYELQHTHRVLVTGPTTLAAILNSLQMGFRTLAIEKSTSEVWKILGAAKAEFEKYAQVWEKVDKQLDTVQNTVRDVSVRTRAIGRKLKNVETLELASGSTMFELEDFNIADEGPEEDL